MLQFEDVFTESFKKLYVALCSTLVTKYNVCVMFLGKYCNGSGLEAVSGDCAPGYYCPEGQTENTPSNYSCPVGYFCVGGKDTPEACPSGTYQVNKLVIPPANCVCGRVYCFHIVRPSIRNERTKVCP